MTDRRKEIERLVSEYGAESYAGALPGREYTAHGALMAAIDSLFDALEALQSRLDAAEPDAKRYQWLRDNEDGLTVVDIIFMDSNEDGPTDVWYSRYGHDLDVAIDAVIAQEQKP